MSLVTDFIRTHLQPSEVFARRIHATSDSRAFADMLLACLFLYLSRIPGILSGQPIDAGRLPTAPVLAGLFLGAMIAAPLMFYLYAAIAKIIMQFSVGRIPWLHSRVVMFWSLLVVAPWTMVTALFTSHLEIGILKTFEAVALICFFTFLLYKGYRQALCLHG